LEGVFLFPSLEQSRLKCNRVEFASSLGLSHASPSDGIVLNLTLLLASEKIHFSPEGLCKITFLLAIFRNLRGYV
jgi:hypothetical protein